MRYRIILFSSFFLLWGWIPHGLGDEYSLQYFLSRLNSKSEVLSRRERTALIDQIHRRLEKVREVNSQVIHRLQTGGIEMSYQEGDFWATKLKGDRKSVDEAIGQARALQQNPNHLVAAIQLYKLMKDLSTNLNALNNIPPFSAMVGDLGPELGLWADPVFYQLYLLPLAKDKNMEKGIPPKSKKPSPPAKKP